MTFKKKDKMNKMVGALLTEAEHKQFKMLAEVKGTTMSNYCRQLVLKEIRK